MDDLPVEAADKRVLIPAGKSVDLSKMGDELTTQEKRDAYAKLANKMRAKGLKWDVVDETLSNQEDMVKKLQEMFGLEKAMIREWLVSMINKQIDKDGVELEGFMIKMGPKEIYLLVNAVRESLGFFGKMFSPFFEHEVTGKAVDRLFGDRNGKYDPKKDDKTLDKWVKTMKEEVLVFAGAVAPNAPLQEVLKLFAATRFVSPGEGGMAEGVKTALFKLGMKNIEIKYPHSTDKNEEEKNEQTRKVLEAALKTHIYGDKEHGIKPDIVNSLILKNNKDDKGETFDYFKGHESSVLLASFPSIFRALASSDKIRSDYYYTNKIEPVEGGGEIDENEILYLAGLATLCGENGLISQLEETGGREKDVYDIIMTGKGDALVFAITDFGLGIGKSGWPDHPTIGPQRKTLREWIDWLKHKPLNEVSLAVRIASSKKEVPTEAHYIPSPSGPMHYFHG